MEKYVFCVTAYRFGNKESHSYVVGVYEKEKEAIKFAEEERKYRGGKYECEVIKIEMESYRSYKIIVKSLGD